MPAGSQRSRLPNWRSGRWGVCCFASTRASRRSEPKSSRHGYWNYAHPAAALLTLAVGVPIRYRHGRKSPCRAKTGRDTLRRTETITEEDFVSTEALTAPRERAAPPRSLLSRRLLLRAQSAVAPSAAAATHAGDLVAGIGSGADIALTEGHHLEWAVDSPAPGRSFPIKVLNGSLSAMRPYLPNRPHRCA